MGGVAGQSGEDGVRYVRRDLADTGRRWCGSTLVKLEENVTGFPGERQLVAHQRISHHGQTIDIGTVVGVPAQRLLRRHVGRSADQVARRRLALRVAPIRAGGMDWQTGTQGRQRSRLRRRRYWHRCWWTVRVRDYVEHRRFHRISRGSDEGCGRCAWPEARRNGVFSRLLRRSGRATEPRAPARDKANYTESTPGKPSTRKCGNSRDRRGGRSADVGVHPTRLGR